MAAVSAARAGVSPSSSPRLPSPPPIPEVQFGPKSPGMTDISNELSLDAPGKPDEGAARRIRPGTKAADMALGPPLVPLNQLDSPFQLQEHLKALYSHLTHTSESTHTIPISKETASQLATSPQLNENESIDRNLWLYELCRFLTQKANVVSIFLMNDNPPCSSQTCPEMRASEWQYLCAVHEPPKSCCAIDYCNHTLDWAANVLTSPKHFPSRLALGGEGGNALQSMRQLTNIFRRVYRIFAHAWFQHRGVFWSVEATYGLYILFKVVCDEYHLIPEDSYTIPPEAEGLPESPEDRSNTSTSEAVSRMQILRKDNPDEASQDNNTSATPSDAPTTTTISTGATTRRHKHTPSTGSHVGTIVEGHEEDEEHTANLAPTDPESTETESTNTDADKPEPPPERHFPKLDIDATVPKYEARAPEDPTPTATAEDVDPLSATKTAVREGSPEEIQTPITARHDEGIYEDRVMSPSGGSIRTGGPDVLKAILGHIDDLDDEDIQLGSPITQGRTSPEKSVSPGKNASPGKSASPGKKEAAEASRINVEVEETTDDEDGAEKKQSAKQAEQAQEKKDE